MTVRNFWVEVDIDGRHTVLSGGPRARDGGLSLTLYQRSGGEIVETLSVLCRARTDGSLWAVIQPCLSAPEGQREILIETRR